MSEGEELPSWTGGPQNQSAAAEVVYAQKPPTKWGRNVLAALVGTVVLVGMGVLGYTIAQRQAESETATDDAQVAAPTAEEGSDGDDAAAADELESTDAGEDATLTVDVEDEDAESNADDEPTTDDEDGDDTSGDATTGDDAASARTAVFRGGKVYLGGKVPSQEIADLIEGKAAAVLGPDNVVVEYEIDPTVTIDPGESTPLIVEDVVLFRFNSVSIDPPFLPLLDIGAALLLQNPQASLTVITRTDATGSEEINLEVATSRAEAVTNYLIRRGVNPDQVRTDPRGEEGASEGDDEQAAALQRRAEFIITGLLD